MLAEASGITVQDDLVNNIYPMPLLAKDKDDVFVGRIRRDHSLDHGLNLWIVSDNLRKGGRNQCYTNRGAFSGQKLAK